MELLSRKKAITIGSPSYFTGKPCVHGHVAPRKTTTGYCRDCQKVHTKKWLKNRKVEIQQALAKFRAKRVD